jgi:hypothetical protein
MKFPLQLKKKKKKKYNTVTKYDSKNKEYFEKSSSWLAQLRLAYISPIFQFRFFDKWPSVQITARSILVTTNASNKCW